jgi:hypothetical protein
MLTEKKKVLYKLTNEAGKTLGGMVWAEGTENRATGEKNQELCSDGWLHAYEHPLIAVLLNPIHADFKNPRMFEVEGKVEKRDGQLKCGCRRLKVLREIPLPQITTAQKIRFAIYCALEVYKKPTFKLWAGGWLSGKDRTAEAAWAAAEAAESAAWAAEAAAWAAERSSVDLFVLAEKAIADEGPNQQAPNVD